MSMAVSLSDEIIQVAKIHSKVCNRSMAKQIEYWTKIGKMAEENPDLTYESIRGIALSLEEKKAGFVEEYVFD